MAPLPRRRLPRVDDLPLQLARDGTAHTGVLRMLAEASAPHADRSLHAQGDCTELVEAIALSISVALDPVATMRTEESPAAPTAATSDVPAPPPPPAATERAPPRRASREGGATSRISLGLGPTLSIGDAPAPVVGALVYAAIQHGVIGGVVEANATLEGTTKTTARVRASSWSAIGLAGVCARASLFFGCGMGSLGVLSANANAPFGRRDTALVAMVGPRAGLVTTLGKPWLELRVHVDALLSLTRHRLALSGRDFYEYAPGRLGGGAAVGMRF